MLGAHHCGYARYIVVARPGCSPYYDTNDIIITGLVLMDCDRKVDKCEVYSKINQSLSTFIDRRGLF